MSQTSYISFRRLAQFWEKVKQWVMDKISEAITPSSDKDVVSVLTYSSTAPANPENEDLWINSSNNTLNEYSTSLSEWSTVTAQSDVLYLTDDTLHIYVYSNSTFVDITGEDVDDTIYVHNLTTDLEEYTDSGIYNVCRMGAAGVKTMYTLVVSKTKTGQGLNTVQTLSNKDGYQVRIQPYNSTFGDWAVVTYATQADLDELKPLIYAGL